MKRGARASRAPAPTSEALDSSATAVAPRRGCPVPRSAAPAPAGDARPQRRARRPAQPRHHAAAPRRRRRGRRAHRGRACAATSPARRSRAAPPPGRRRSTCASRQPSCRRRSRGCRSSRPCGRAVRSSLDVTGQVDAARNRVRALEAERRGVLRQLAAATTPAETADARARLRLVDAACAARTPRERRCAAAPPTARSHWRSRPSGPAPVAAVAAARGRRATRSQTRCGSCRSRWAPALVALAALLPLALVGLAGWGVWALVRARLRRRALATH